MTPIDHAAEAKRLLPKRGEGMMPNHIAAAQVHATLALVEQQRIANLIALARIETENISTPTDALDTIYRREEISTGFGGETRLHMKSWALDALRIGEGDD